MCGEGWPPHDTEVRPRNFLPPGMLQSPITVPDTEDNPLLSEHPLCAASTTLLPMPMGHALGHLVETVVLTPALAKSGQQLPWPEAWRQ